MRSDFASTSLGGVTNLALVAKVKAGFVPGIAESITYLRRLQLVLKVLNGLRQAAREQMPPAPPTDVVGRLNIVHFFRWSILPPRDEPPPLPEEPAPHRLVLNVTFDGGWEPYMRGIWDDLGSTLDLMLCNCEGYKPARLTDYASYLDWVRENEMSGGFFFAENDTSMVDERYLARLEAMQRESRKPEALDSEVAGLAMPPEPALELTEDEIKARLEATTKANLKALVVLHALDRFFDENDGGIAQNNFLRRAAQDILKELAPGDGFGQGGLPPPVADAVNWFMTPTAPSPGAPRVRPNPKLTDVQAGILDGFPVIPEGALVLLAVDNPALARQFLMSVPVSTQADAMTAKLHRTIAISFEGLQALGIAPAWLAALPQEFAHGMQARCGILGDRLGNHPTQWRLPERNWQGGELVSTGQRVDLSTVHVVLQLRSIETPPAGPLPSPTLAAEIEAFGTTDTTGLIVLSVQPLQRNPRGNKKQSREHFGFLDGFSQPVPDVAEKTPSGWSNSVPPGELLLGYRNSRGDHAVAAGQEHPLLDGGSFLVVRKLRQYVDRLNKALLDGAKTLTDDEDAAKALLPDLRAMLMGRTTEGQPLATDRETENDFDYSGDKNGAKCPFHAHVRRANPRGAPVETPQTQGSGRAVPRLARRGMSYGPPYDEKSADAERGLVFMAYMASIAEQFEVIQRWIAGGNSSGSSSAVSDPFAGVPVPGDKRTFRFLLDGDKPCRIDLGDKPFTTLEWGAYYFVPSISALKRLSELTTPPRSRPATKPAAPTATEKWRRALEDDTRREAAWGRVRKSEGGQLATPYGTLLGGREAVRQALRQDGTPLSVCGYGHRMRTSIGLGFLGMDGEDHAKLSMNVNRAIMSDAYGERACYAVAYSATERLLSEAPADGDVRLVDLVFGLKALLAALCTGWFGPVVGPVVGPLANKQAADLDVDDLVATSRYIFSTPQLTPPVEEQGIRGGQAALAGVEAYLQATSTPDKRGPLTQAIAAALKDFLGKAPYDDDGRLLARTVAGIILGFPPTVMGNLISVLSAWMPGQSKRLWSLQAKLRHHRAGNQTTFDEAEKVLREALLKTMMRSPVPATVWRTPMDDCAHGATEPTCGRRVQISLYSACQEVPLEEHKTPDDHRLMFGGHTDEKSDLYAPHACPGYGMAVGVMLGFLAALMDAGDLADAGGLRLSLRPGRAAPVTGS